MKTSQQGFTYTETGTDAIGRCAAVSPTLPGSPPWSVAVSHSLRSSPTTTASVVFDPEQNPLIAPAVFMTYVVQDGISCAPDCQSLYTGGKQWPTELTEPHCNTWCHGGTTIMIVVIVVPIVVFLLMVGFGCWCCISLKRRRREEIEWTSNQRRLADRQPNTEAS